MKKKRRNYIPLSRRGGRDTAQVGDFEKLERMSQWPRPAESVEGVEREVMGQKGFEG